MGKFTESEYEEFLFDERLSKKEHKLLLQWINAYVQVFDDPYVERIYAKWRISRFVDYNSVENVLKRKENIPLASIENLEIYFNRYRNSVTKILFVQLNGNMFPESIRQISSSLLIFFKKYGYLTYKQRTLCYSIGKEIVPFKLKKHSLDNELEIEGILRLRIKKNSSGEKDSINSDSAIDVLTKIEKKEDLGESFLSLSDIRKKMGL